LPEVADSQTAQARGDSGEDGAASTRDEAVRRILLTVAGSIPAGGVGFLVLFIGAHDTPLTGAASLLLVFALGFPPATYALALAPALRAWPRDQARRVAWLAAMASLPMAMLGAGATLVLVAAIDYVL
jgi:hypothetical protein